MAERTGDLVTIPGNLARVQVMDGTNWITLFGASAVDRPQGTRASDTTNAFLGNATVPGVRPIENVTITVASYLPYMPEWSVIRDADAAQRSLLWRFTTKGEIKFPSTTGEVAVAVTTGKVTFSGTPIPNDQILVQGMCIFTGTSGNDHYVISSIDDTSSTTTVTATPKTAYAKAPGFDVAIASLQFEFFGKVSNSGSFTIGAEASQPLASTLIITPDVEFGEPTLIRPTAS